MSDIVQRAKDLAHRAHAGQVDKSGRPYIEHVARVAAACADDPEAEAVAWLHDAAEDHPEYYERIFELMPIPILVAVQLLDRNVDGDYYSRIAANPLALRVKLADIADNADESRLALLDEKTASRLRRKYARAIVDLTEPNAWNQPTCEASSAALNCKVTNLPDCGHDCEK